MKRSEVFTAVKIRVEILWVTTPCSVVVGCQRSMDVWNVGILPQHYTASQPRRPRLR